MMLKYTKNNNFIFIMIIMKERMGMNNVEQSGVLLCDFDK